VGYPLRVGPQLPRPGPGARRPELGAAPGAGQKGRNGLQLVDCHLPRPGDFYDGLRVHPDRRGDARRDRPETAEARMKQSQQPLLEVRDLNIAFETSRGDVRPVRDVSFTIYPGQTVALVGES